MQKLEGVFALLKRGTLLIPSGTGIEELGLGLPRVPHASSPAVRFKIPTLSQQEQPRNVSHELKSTKIPFWVVSFHSFPQLQENGPDIGTRFLMCSFHISSFYLSLLHLSSLHLSLFASPLWTFQTQQICC